MSFDDEFGIVPGAAGIPGLPGEAAAQRGGRPRYRPPIGIPAALPEPAGWRGTVLSVVLHVLIIALLLAPLAAPALMPEVLNEGAGGPGPAGGGGGGRRGTGGQDVQERVRYVSPPSAPAAQPDPTRLQPPVEEKKPEPTPATPAAPIVDIKTDVKLPDVSSVSAVRGQGGGTGSDGSNGSGPGSGGGVGSGVGTGRGSGTGPGTGGGPGTVYPPTPANVVLPPMNLAQKHRPYTASAFFDVDERGNATLIAVQPPTGDRDYNRKLYAALRDYRFRPAVRWDGTPVRDTAVVEFTLP
jgi:protein TonB